ncbi:integrase [Aphanothece hegewaldii CCALA 016]|uniref:Integrase n=1 Tax=Aphanothece hegewaldii CCALA 016 TaxID=2107694 RepID=A0A2T1LVM9_9CHRO|nr:site-specific integrase [Aphanothece hegewaldii]PSF35777.1 integrase [Aphanothece hegewaldii CCALA 016]
MDRNTPQVEWQATTHHPLALSSPLPLVGHPAWVYLSHLSKRSRSTMHRHLDAIAFLLTSHTCDALTLDWGQLRYPHAILLRLELPKYYAPSTVNQMLSAFKRVMEEAKKLKLIPPGDYVETIDIEPLKTNSKALGRLLSRTEMAALMNVCHEDESVIGLRDAAMLAILFGTGMRRSELVALNLENYKSATGAIAISSGKGNKFRLVYLPSSGQLILSKWLEIRGLNPGALLMPISKTQKLQGRHLSEDAVLYLLRKCAIKAGIASFTPHDCRRTFISNLLEAGVDLVTVSQLAGHSSVTTTAKYDRRGEEAKRAAVNLLNLPF